MRLRRTIIQTALALCAVFYWFAGRPSAESGAEPIDWSGEPLQTETERPSFALSTRRGDVTLTPRAAYEVAAVVEGVEPYRLDPSAFLSPVDFVLTWGELPTPEWRTRLSYWQSARFFFWRASGAIDSAYVVAHAANTHLIPATPNLRRALLAVDAGDAVRLRGLLVDVAGAQGFRWHTSLARTDHGDVGCELLYVESLEVGGRFYR